jgi:hypothetical protein
MQRTSSATAATLDFGDLTHRQVRRALRLIVTRESREADKYRVLDLKRRRAQIRARRALGVS